MSKGSTTVEPGHRFEEQGGKVEDTRYLVLYCPSVTLLT